MRNIIVALLLLSNVVCFATSVTSSAGDLSNLVSDKTITSLTVSGEIDARDLAFIADELTELTALDLSRARIVAFSGTEPVIGESLSFDANVLPANVFFGKNYSSVVLPSTLTSIGASALAGCASLTSIAIPASVTTISDDAINASGMTILTLPATIETMGARVAANCASLTSATVNCSVLGDEAFAGCFMLTDVVIGDDVQTIGSGAFKGSAVTDVVFTQNSGLQAIGDEAFMNTPIEDFDFASLSELQTIGMWAFANSRLKSVALGDNVQDIGDGAFFYNTELEQVDLSSGAIRIGDYLFAGDNAIDNESVVPEGYTQIGDYAFYNWDQVAQFILPASLTEIGDGAMAGMTGLSSITSHATDVPSLGNDVWDGVDQSHVTLYVDKNSINAYKGAQQWKEFNIAEDPTGIDEITATKPAVTAHFSGSTLIVSSTQELIQEICVYETNGILLTRLNPMSENASIEMLHYGGKLYLVTVTLRSGKTVSFKLSR
ncbi:MAG: leucine-rich repeat domain-containing protein [Muribaculaceae bacterium]|nr:leucine-rich repeat domain-containing protein [Muribaculaceae bacterium]